MKKLVAPIFILVLFLFFSCSGRVEISPEMKSFVEGLGISNKVDVSLKKYGIPGLDTMDMDMYDLMEPKVIGASKDGKKTTYTFEAKAGMAVRTYDITWENGKIVKVADKGMK